MSSNSTPAWLRSIPPVTRNLIIINVLIWVLEFIPGFEHMLMRRLALHFWGAEVFNPVQFITYAFIHDPGNPLHVGFNMFTLWMFGRLMEQVWGSRRFLIFYFVCAVGAALMQELVWQFTWVNELAELNKMPAGQMSALLDQWHQQDPAALAAQLLHANVRLRGEDFKGKCVALFHDLCYIHGVCLLLLWYLCANEARACAQYTHSDTNLSYHKRVRFSSAFP